MGSRGDCFDNAVAETFFATLRKEPIRREGPFPTRAELRLALFDYIEAFFNRTRRHSILGYLSPVEYDRVNPLNQKSTREPRPRVNQGQITVSVKAGPAQRSRGPANGRDAGDIPGRAGRPGLRDSLTRNR
jgi:hypothetical protein